MKKTISLVILLAMLASAMLGVVSFADSAAPELKVAKANIELGNVIYLYIAVDYTAFESADGITLKVTNNKTGKTTVLKPKSSIIAPEGCVAFRYDTEAFKAMGDELTLQAMKDGKASGEAKTYSVLEYALRAETIGDTVLTELVQAMIALGASSQKLYKYEGTYDLSKSWGLVRTPNSTEKKAIAPAGSTLTLTSAEAGKTILCHYGAKLERLEGTTITVEAGCRTYLFASESDLAE